MTMQFRRSGQRDGRRRRVLLEETCLHDAEKDSGTSTAGQASAKAKSKDASFQRYPHGTLSERQPLLVAAIPTGWGTIIAIAGLLLAAIAALEAAYGYVALGHTPFSLADVPAIDLMSRASIIAWSNSIILVLAAQMGVLTYFIRRHRVDDYRGRYRMWYWMVPVLMVAALDQVSNLQETVRSALLILAGIPNYADAATIWLSVVAVLTVVVLLRLAIEVRDSRLALLSLLVSSGCYAAAAAAGVRWILAEDTVFRVMATAGLRLGGHAALFMTIVLNARYVFRDAEGRICHTRRARRLEKKHAAAETTDKSKTKRQRKGRIVRHDPAHATQETKKQSENTRKKKPARPANVSASTSKTTSKRRSSNNTTSEPAERKIPEPTDDAPNDDAQPRKLTKAERRKLRKMRRRQRSEAA